MTAKQDILKLEATFWDTMAAGEHRMSASMLASHSTMFDAQGAVTFTPDEYIAMAGRDYEKPGSKIVDWKMTDEKVVFPTEDTAICTYNVATKTDTGENEPRSAIAVTVWAKDADDWKCILHGQTPNPHVKA